MAKEISRTCFNSHNKANKEKGKKSPEPNNRKGGELRIHITKKLNRHDLLVNRLNTRKPKSAIKFVFEAQVAGLSKARS